MPISEPLDFEQPKNDLSSIAETERKRLIIKNDYRTTNQYSAINPDAIGDGDAQGKGTGGFLDTTNQSAGAIQDIIERKAGIVINEYKSTNPYTKPTA